MAKPTVTAFRYPLTKAEMPRGPYAQAGVLVETNAGWRLFRPVIDGAKCGRCEKCWLICPDGAVDRTTTGYSIDYNYCKGCGLCAQECPAKAVAMVKEDGAHE